MAVAWIAPAAAAAAGAVFGATLSNDFLTPAACAFSFAAASWVQARAHPRLVPDGAPLKTAWRLAPSFPLAAAPAISWLAYRMFGGAMTYFPGVGPAPSATVACAGIAGSAWLAAWLTPSFLGLLRDLPPDGEVGLRARFVLWMLAAALPIAFWTTLTWPCAGDEPHLLLMSDNLLRPLEGPAESRFDLRTAYATARWTQFYPAMNGNPTPAARRWIGEHAFLGPRGEYFPTHYWGLPLLMAPFVAFGGTATLPVVGALLLALFGWLSYRIARLAGASHSPAIASALLVAFSAPVAATFSRPMVETPAAVLIAGAFALGLRPQRSLLSNGAVALLVCALPWLHVRFAPAALAIGWFSFRQLGPSILRLLPGIGAASGIASLSIFSRVEYGFWRPDRIFEHALPSGRFPLAWNPGDLSAWAGSLGDPLTGYWVVWPAGLILLAGLSRRTLASATVFAVTLLPIAMTNVWQVDTFGRMFAAAAGPAAAPLALAIERSAWTGRGVRFAVAAAAAASLATTGWLLAVPGSILAFHPLGLVLPRWTAPGPSTWIFSGFLFVAAIAFFGMQHRRARPG